MSARRTLLLLFAAAVQAVPTPTGLLPVPSTKLEPPPIPQSAGDFSWEDVIPKIPDSDEMGIPKWGDEPSEELQPPPVGVAVGFQLNGKDSAKPIDIEVKYKEQKLSAPDSKQAYLKATVQQFPKKYRPDLHKAEGGAKKNLSPKPAAPEQEPAESSYSAVVAGAGTQNLGDEHLGDAVHLSSGGDRVEFQMHGQNGPNSYKFGFDTGNVHNRLIRYEERDAHGNVKGHYGFYDKSGKLHIVNYSADPHTGYHAQPGVVG
ncbi:uncharacterized protein LOC126100674 [Schistocerca cancellata]|uniref:uncharacterized protein LOC126100674 n=1 Tax=Schistocerca cancellata TaxID=274614 RepID=UPI0021196C47|nr:uncharacterized protein LOC126100674 [Schistocerca cancellata]